MAAQLAVERFAFLLRVRKLSGTRLGLEATYRDWSVLVGCSVPPVPPSLKLSLPATRFSNHYLLITLSFKLIPPEVVISR